MTDNEIIKALECASYYDCDKCPHHQENCDDRIADQYELSKDAIDLINRQQANKDRLQRLLDEEERKNTTLAKQMFKSGVKDFGKLLIDKSKNGVISICDIPDLVKEMVGEE